MPLSYGFSPSLLHSLRVTGCLLRHQLSLSPEMETPVTSERPASLRQRSPQVKGIDREAWVQTLAKQGQVTSPNLSALHRNHSLSPIIPRFKLKRGLVSPTMVTLVPWQVSDTSDSSQCFSGVVPVLCWALSACQVCLLGHPHVGDEEGRPGRCRPLRQTPILTEVPSEVLSHL